MDPVAGAILSQIIAQIFKTYLDAVAKARMTPEQQKDLELRVIAEVAADDPGSIKDPLEG